MSERRPWPRDPRYLIGEDGSIVGPSGRVVMGHVSSNGYRVIGVWDSSVRRNRNRPVHALVAETFHGPRPTSAHQVAHGNGDRLDNRPENLRWVTNGENQRDAVRHGTHGMTSRTHCPRGHQLVEPNIVAAELARGKRSCLACARARARAQYRPELDLQVEGDRHFVRIMGLVSAA